jgi:predicted RNA-binding protein associated with RNAse of E/G family
MDLLDASIALALTIGALATMVTLVMEAGVRCLNLRAEGQLELFRKIYDEAVAGRFTPSEGRAGGKGEFLRRVLANPLLDAPPDFPEEAGSGARVGRNEVYEWVSHEHVLRRVLELEGAVVGPREALRRRVRDFAREYDVLCSAASVQFRQRRRFWSIGVGVALAILVNANAVRIFDEFLKHPALTSTMIARAETLEQAAVDAEARLEDALGEGAVPAAQAEEAIRELEQSVEELRGGLDGLRQQGLPLGYAHAPHCWYLDSCAEGVPVPTGGDVLPRWLVLALATLAQLAVIAGTGLLMGLGAPFWFDVAKRLAQVRTAFGGVGGTEDAHNGISVRANEAGGRKLDELIDRVLDDFVDDPRNGVRRLLTERRTT